MTTLQDMLARRKAERANSIRRDRSRSVTKKTEPVENTKIRIIISTYNRPQHLTRLLRDVMASRVGYEISIAVYDDASESDYEEPCKLLEHLGGEYIRAPRNHGKRGFWRWVSRIYGDQKSRTESLFFLLPDDVRLASNFFGRALSVWHRIKDLDKVALTLLRDTGRDGTPCWTGKTQKDVDGVTQSGWADGAILCNRAYFEKLGWAVESVPAERWLEDPTLSSGVGKQISHRLCDQGAGLYLVKRSLIVHVAGPSTMNPEARSDNPLRSLSFVDGEEIHRVLLGGQNITCSMASVPRRRDLLKQVVASLRPQCDRLNVYLNGYAEVPEFLRKPWIVVATSQEHGGRGDAGKFFWCDQLGDGYHLTVDDDLAYPSNYVSTMLGRVERYGRKAVVGVHGVVLPASVGDSYYNDRHVYHCLLGVDVDVAVHLLGTGAVAYHTDAIVLSPTDFRIMNMADVWLALAARRQAVPMVCVAHEKSWLAELNDPQPAKSIYATHRDHDALQALHLRSAGRWGPPITAGKVSCGERPGPRQFIRAPKMRRNATRNNSSVQVNANVHSSVRMANPNVRKLK